MMGVKDFRMGVVWDKGMGIVSISFARGMVNSMILTEETELWLPGGLDWYGVDKIKKILDQENKRDLANEIFYYNLGFLTDKVVFLDDFSWDRSRVLLPNMGLRSWLNFVYRRDQMIFKEEMISGALEDEGLFLNEVMIRDFADSQLLNEDLRLIVLNTTENEGLAGFVAEKLLWAGFSVMGVGGAEAEVEKCRLSYGEGSDKSYGWQVLSSLFDCEWVEDEALADFEVEVYIGEGMAEMINYSGYVRTF